MVGYLTTEYLVFWSYSTVCKHIPYRL